MRRMAHTSRGPQPNRPPWPIRADQAQFKEPAESNDAVRPEVPKVLGFESLFIFGSFPCSIASRSPMPTGPNFSGCGGEFKKLARGLVAVFAIALGRRACT